MNLELPSQPPTIHEAVTNLVGTVGDADGDTVSYRVRVFDQTGKCVGFFTPGSTNSLGFHEGSGTNVALASLDLTGLQDGPYQAELTACDGWTITSVTNAFILDSQLKIGQFSFSVQDAILPVNGIPLTVTRTYNSLRPEPGAFGPCWTMSLNDMNVAIDEQRQDVTDDDGQLVNLRMSGGYDVTLTLPDGRRTTFTFGTDQAGAGAPGTLYPKWEAPPGVYAELKPLGNPFFNGLGWPQWQADGWPCYNLAHFDFPGWELDTPDGTRYIIQRPNLGEHDLTDALSLGGAGEDDLLDDPTAGNDTGSLGIRVYGAPYLARIIERSGNRLEISSNGIEHFDPGSSTASRSVRFDRDSHGRITAIYDPNSLSDASAPAPRPLVRYNYDPATENLVAVETLIDRNAGEYNLTSYHYTNTSFPHLITAIIDPRGVPLARNEYDNAGKLTAIVDADGNRTEFIHNPTNKMEVVIDRLHHTNTFVYDLRGNVTATTNALGGITLMAYDGDNNKTNEVVFLEGQPYATNRFVYTTNSLLLASFDPLGQSNVFTYNDFGQVVTSTDARGNTSTNYYSESTGLLLGASDALGNLTTNVFDDRGLLAASRDAAGTWTTNSYDDVGNLRGTVVYGVSSEGYGMLSTNSAAFDANGNQTNSVVWRRVNGAWEGATNTYYVDAQNRVVETVDPYGYTNSAVYGPSGRQEAAIDKLGRVTQYDFDAQGRQYRTIYPDLSSVSSAFDAEGRVRFSTNQLAHVTEYRFDALGRQTNVIYPDLAQSSTVYDGLGRVRFSVDGRAVTNAFGYDRANRRVAVTNALGTTEQTWSTYAFDRNGNQVCVTNVAGVLATNYFDAVNRVTNVSFVDGTKVFTVFDPGGRRVAETNQDNIVTLFGYDGLGRLLCVTNALGTTNEMVTRYTFDEAGNQTAQIDALLRTNRFGYNLLSQRVWHSQPGDQTEWFAYDAAGSLVRHTNFNSIVITNGYDLMNRLTNVASVDGYAVGFTYTATGQRQTMSDPSGVTTYEYDDRDRLLLKRVSWSGGPEISLNYAYDLSGNVTNIWSSTVNGVNLRYEHDCLNRITNVLANGSLAASYGFDLNGNLQSLRYGNAVTNLWQYDLLNRLTNSVCKSNALTLASFYYQLGKTGNRTNLTETLFTAVTNRTYSWTHDALYRLRSETISGLGSTSYGLDKVGNRTTRTAGLDGLPAQTFSYGSNDWVTTDAYDSNGNTLWSTNGGTATGPYYYDVENRLTNFNNSVYFAYNGDGARVSKTVGGTTTTYFLIDDRNPTGYAQVLEEWTGSGGAPSLSRVYNFGLALLSQKEDSTIYYFVPDGHGSMRLLVDGNGTIANAFGYDAYGNLIASNTAPQTAYLYCGEYFDSYLGFVYLRDRLDNPQTGRFLTQDSFQGRNRNPLSLHKYLYCEASPCDRSDPSGFLSSGSSLETLTVTAIMEGLAATLFLTSPFIQSAAYLHSVDSVRHDLENIQRECQLFECVEFVAKAAAVLKKKGLREPVGWQIIYYQSLSPFVEGHFSLDIYAAHGFGRYGGMKISEAGFHAGILVRFSGEVTQELISDNNVLMQPRQVWIRGYLVPYPDDNSRITIDEADRSDVGEIVTTTLSDFLRKFR